jgi:site-specific recombinase XerD
MNPAKGVPMVNQVPAPPSALDRLDMNRLMRAVYKEEIVRDIAIMELLLNTGLRVGEVEELRVDDIEITDRKGNLIVRQGKGGKFRVVPLNKDVRRALTDYNNERSQIDTTALFVSKRKQRLTANAIWRLVKKYGELAGLLEVHPHSLRHTFGTRLVREHNIDLVTAAQLMGHSSVQTTAIYTRATQVDLDNAVERLIHK